MTQKQLKKLSRRELLEMLIELRQKNEELERQLEKANKKLKNRKLAVENVGTMAEASMLLNGVYRSVDKAARQYLENIQMLAEEQRNEKK